MDNKHIDTKTLLGTHFLVLSEEGDLDYHQICWRSMVKGYLLLGVGVWGLKGQGLKGAGDWGGMG